MFAGNNETASRAVPSKIIVGVNQFRIGEELSLKKLLLMPFKEIPKNYSLFPGKD